MHFLDKKNYFSYHKQTLEKIILSLIALLTGLLVAGVGFYFYQSTKTIIPQSPKTISVTPPSPTTQSINILSLSSPTDEAVVDKKSVTISGHTEKDAIVVISTSISDEVVKPAGNGNFSTTVPIEDGENFIEITAILPNGQEQKEVRTVTFSTENF